MRLKYWWPVMLGMAAGCGGGTADDAGPAMAGGTETAKTAEAGPSAKPAEAPAGTSSQTPAEKPAEAPAEQPAEGAAVEIARDAAPDFEIEVFDGGGKKVKLSSLKGKVVLMSFWGID